MWKSVIYKEWLKIRWFVLLFAGLGMLAVAYIFLRVQHDFKFNEPQNYWYLVMFQNFQFFGPMKFIPIVGALALSIAQYFPETVSKRIKLTFHLPINENKVLLMMMLLGTACLFAAYILLLGLFYALSSIYFPSNVILPSLLSITPWFLAGFSTYYLVALIVLEPVWKYRFLYFIVTAAFIPLFLESGLAGAYAPANLMLALFTVLLSISLLFSGYRFRKGEM